MVLSCTMYLGYNVSSVVCCSCSARYRIYSHDGRRNAPTGARHDAETHHPYHSTMHALYSLTSTLLPCISSHRHSGTGRSA